MSKPRAKKTKPTPTRKSTFDLRVVLETAGVARHVVKFGDQKQFTLKVIQPKA